MKISYAILAHNNPKQLSLLVDKLNTKNSIFIIHIDKKSEISDFKNNIYGHNIFFLEGDDRISCTWGDYSLVKATLNCMKLSIAKNKAGRTVLLSGSDLPIHDNDTIYEFFTRKSHIEFIDIKPIEEAWPTSYFYRLNSFKIHLSNQKEDFFCIPSIFTFRPRAIIRSIIKTALRSHTMKNISFIKNLSKLFNNNKPNNKTKFYGGHQWWALNNSTIEDMLSYLEMNQWFCDFFKNTLIPDEVFFQTLIKKVNKDITIGNCLTFTKWASKTTPSPDLLKAENYTEIIEEKKKYLFARKFDLSVDSEIILLLGAEKCTKIEI